MKPACSLLRGALLALAFTCVPIHQAAAQVRIATDANGQSVHIDGSVVVIEPDIELSLVTAGGLQEPRKEWSEPRPASSTRRPCMRA